LLLSNPLLSLYIHVRSFFLYAFSTAVNSIHIL
jgi:hypothetical protein